MTAAVPTSPGPPPSTSVGVLANTLPGAFWHAATSSPWIIALWALIALMLVARFVRELVVGPIVKDTARTFSRSQKNFLLARAGHRCERHGWLFGRCKQTTKLEADHVHPHSKGGWTRLENGQILCRQHNKLKRANVPWDFELRAIEKQRLTYYPAGVSGAVVRRAPRARRAGRQFSRRVRGTPSEPSWTARADNVMTDQDSQFGTNRRS